MRVSSMYVETLKLLFKVDGNREARKDIEDEKETKSKYKLVELKLEELKLLKRVLNLLEMKVDDEIKITEEKEQNESEK